MIRIKLLSIILLIALFSVIFTAHTLAQEGPDSEVPVPYNGMENPFSWEDVSARNQGEEIYQRSCSSCHGVAGDGIPDANFGTAEFMHDLESNPDYYFWKLSEGERDSGMPAYKSSLTEEQRWQVLTYLWDLGKEIPPDIIQPPAETPEVEDLDLLLVTAEQGQAGQPMFLTAILRNNQGEPVPDAGIKFFIKADFFINDLMEIGEAITDENGAVTFEYIPRQAGEIEVTARYETIENSSTVSLIGSDSRFYETEVGLEAWALGEETLVNLPLFGEPEDNTNAPQTVLRLPTGALVWGTPLLLIVIGIWATCFYVGYQLYSIPITREIQEINTKLVPTIILGVITLLGILLPLMLITGPGSR